MSDNRSTSDPTVDPDDGTKTAPVSEADDAPPDPADLQTPPGEHAGELPGDNDGAGAAAAEQFDNAESSEEGEPSQ